MKTYSIHIHDDRHGEPILLIADVRNDERIGEVAREKLRESEHYRAIDVLDEGRVLFRIHREDAV